MQKKHRNRILIAIVAMVVVFNPVSLVILLFGLIFWSNAHPETGVNEKRVSWLPEAATNVSYYKTYSFTAFEFDISEDGFRKWAARWDIKEIDKPVSVMRYTFMTLNRSDPQWEDFPKYESQTRAEIKVGYYWRTPPSNDGGGTYVAYDPSVGKAYYQSNPR